MAGDEHVLVSEDYYAGGRKAANVVLRETHLLEKLIVKIGVPLLLLDNVDVSNGWTNGTVCVLLDVRERGLLVRHSTNRTTKWLKKASRSVPGTGCIRNQYPVTVAFACTIHKVQSMTLPAVAIHLSAMQSHGQLYVAMSRVKSGSDISFFGFRKGIDKYMELVVDQRSVDLVHKLEMN